VLSKFASLSSVACSCAAVQRHVKRVYKKDRKDKNEKKGHTEIEKSYLLEETVASRKEFLERISVLEAMPHF